MLKANTNFTIKNFLKNTDFIWENSKNSPVNFVFPESFSENIEHYKTFLNTQNFKSEIFYAHKSNKETIFLENVKKSKIWIDVASFWELKNALKTWIETDKIEATWPKNEEFLQLCIQNNILINVDSFSELETILKLKKEEKIKILLRISGFKNSKISRFWIEISKSQKIIKILKKYKNDFIFKGCSLHIDTISLKEKVKAIEEILLLYKDFQKNGFFPRILNIWWGHRISYLEKREEWETYQNKSKEEEVSWYKNGIWNNIYTPFQKTHWIWFLKEILESKLENFENMELWKYLEENIITLQIEPGRSLHNHTGISLTKVISTKEINWENLIILDTNSFWIGSREQELFSNPIILSKKQKIKSEKWVFFAWNLCLESDFITKHKRFLWCSPEVWDLVLFLNTGWYLQNFYENSAILQKDAKSITIQ